MHHRATLGILLLLSSACASESAQTVDEASSLPYAEGSPEAEAIVAVANDTSLDLEAFDASDQVGLDRRAAENIVAHRDGEDLVSTADDDPFDSLAELYGVPYCKASCLNQLLAYAKKTGVYDALGESQASVLFSPQPSLEASHLAEAAARIDEAEHSIDIAMYSYSHQGPVRAALERARDRGVTIRMLADTDLASSASTGGALEALGIDVRRTTKIMHHKFAIIDGPRDPGLLDRAESATLVTGSANWSSSAATLYDENTLFLEGYPELALRLQRDFDTLWAGSKDVVYNGDLSWDRTSADLTDAIIAEYEDADSHAYFTSVNFSSNSSGSWSYLGTTAVTDMLVDTILGADASITIASGHFISTPIAQAVVDAMADNPALDVRIVLDCQEVSKSGPIVALKSQIESAGGTIGYKCNTYRWHYKYARQMHHKYLVIDGDTLYTGSLNLSDNAETNTFENMLMFSGAKHAALVASYEENFEVVASYGHANDMAALGELYDEAENGSEVPLSWSTPITMDLATVDALKTVIRAECPAAQPWADTPEAKTYDKYFTSNPQWFTYCEKSGYPWPKVPVDLRQ